MYIYSYDNNVFSIKDKGLTIVKADRGRQVGIIPYYIQDGIVLKNILKICCNDDADFILTDSNKVYYIESYADKPIEDYMKKLWTDIKDFSVSQTGLCYINMNSDLYYYNHLLYPIDKRKIEYKQIIPMFISNDVKIAKLYLYEIYYLTHDGSLYKYRPLFKVNQVGSDVDFAEPVQYIKEQIIKSNVNNFSISNSHIFVLDKEFRLAIYNKHTYEGGYILNNDNYVLAKDIYSFGQTVLYMDLSHNLWQLHDDMTVEHIAENVFTAYVNENGNYFYI